MKNIYDLTIEQLEDYFLSLGEKKFKATYLSLSIVYILNTNLLSLK